MLSGAFGQAKALLPGQGLLHSSVCYMTVVPLSDAAARAPVDSDEEILETSDVRRSASGPVMVMQGFYKNPGLKQSRSARFGGPFPRSEEEALGIVLSWMELQHSQASERARIGVGSRCLGPLTFLLRFLF